MADSGLASPVVVDGRVTDEKLNELLALQAEYPELDYKRRIDLGSAEGPSPGRACIHIPG